MLQPTALDRRAFPIGYPMVENFLKLVMSRGPKQDTVAFQPYQDESLEVLAAYRSISNERIRQSIKHLIIMVAAEEHLNENAA